jgi:excinuclease ABC subunit C
MESPSPRVKRSGGLKAERVFLPNRLNAVLLPPSGRGLLLLQRIRDEAHRFAIEFQRDLRRRASLTSVLEDIPGIGPGKRKSLLRALGSLRAVREAPLETLAAVPGLSPRDAETIRGFFDALRPAEG